MGNMACGFYAIMSAHIGNFTEAATAICLGVVFDMLDGRVARLVHGESSFGVEFDSLADFLTFCVTPAYMMCALLFKDYGPIGYVSSFLFTLCGGLRLARFNAVAQAGEGSKKTFQGLPTPAAAGFLASFVLLYEIVEQGKSTKMFSVFLDLVPVIADLGPVLMIALAFLMVSNVPYGAFKQQKSHSVRPMFFAGTVMVLLYYFPENSLFFITLSYILSGLFGVLLKIFPKRTSAAS